MRLLGRWEEIIIILMSYYERGIMMDVLYKIDEKEVLKEKLLNDGCKIILARWVRKELNNEIQYVTWWINPKDNLTHQGNYFKSFEEAHKNFLERT